MVVYVAKRGTFKKAAFIRKGSIEFFLKGKTIKLITETLYNTGPS